MRHSHGPCAMPPEPRTSGLPALVLAVAPNGARRGKADHPALPITPAETANEAEACLAAGATLLHLHVRDGEGRHSLDAGLYREAIAEIRARVGDAMAIQITTEAVGRHTPEEQIAVVRALRPEAVSIAMREIAPGPAEEPAAARLFAWMREAGVSPQIILYEADEVRRFQALCRAGVFPQTSPFPLFVLGRYVGPGDPVFPRELLPFLAAHEPSRPWALCAFGVEETASLLAAAALGGHVRVGFENSLWHGDGQVAADNAERVARIAEGARLIGRPLADIARTRALLAEAAA